MPSGIESRLMTFGELLLGSKHYSVPIFQRDYSWTDTEVGELWTDIVSTIDEGRKEHFMGAIVADNSEKHSLVLIDGQQRLATVSLLMCVIRDKAKEKGDTVLFQKISDDYLGDLNLRTRRTQPKLTLNERNNQFYQDNVIEPKETAYLRDLSKKRGLDKSNKLLLEAYLLLHRLVHERITQSGDFEESLIQIEECIREKFITILISVTDLANAYLIFETLNDRGLDLSVADLLKNYLFSKAEGRLQQVKKRWEEISIVLGKFELTKFIRHYWMSHNGTVREKDLYRAISNQLKNSTTVFNFVKQLRESAEVYGAFEVPESQVWDSYNSAFKNDIARLGLFKVNQCYPVLLAAKETLPDSIFPKVLRLMVMFSFRYSVICGFGTGNLETAYGETAKFIRSRKPRNVKDIFALLSKLYPRDDEFKRYFAEKTISNARLARYILNEINNRYMGEKELITNPEETDLNLEHILPRNPSNLWLTNFKDSDINQYTHRLGNLTLLDASVNRRIGNTSFRDKSTKVFSKSKLKITKEILSYTDWGPEQIEDRQNKMATTACQIWRLDF